MVPPVVAKDDEAFIKFGLERNFTPFMALCFSFSAVGVLTALSQVVAYGLTTGGPAVMVWGWLGASVLNLCVAYSMGEICSIFPGVGSVYFWTSSLCTSPRWQLPLSYCIGWISLWANV